jgi:hypothetical protein
MTLAFSNFMLDTQGLLECMPEGLKIIRVLMAADETMRYNVWLRLIGAIPAYEPWPPASRESGQYRRLTTLIPRALAAVARLNGEQIARQRGEPGIEFWRIVNESGEPGLGISDDVRIEV